MRLYSFHGLSYDGALSCISFDSVASIPPCISGMPLHLLTLPAHLPSSHPACRFDIEAMMRGELLDEFIDALAEAAVEEKLASMEGRVLDKKAVSNADD